VNQISCATIGAFDRQRTDWQFAEPRLTSGAFAFSGRIWPVHPPGFVFWSGYFRRIANAEGKANIEVRQIAPGGCCQWVLDAICEIVEWPSQPLRFDSVVLRTALDISNSRHPGAPML